MINPEIQRKILPIRFLILDVDGVMSDGKIIYGSNGEELKFFDAKDGAGLKYWRRAGHEAGIITGRASPMVMRRAEELDIARVVMGSKAKLPAFEQLLAEAGLFPHEVAVMGDDLMEMPLLARAGLGIAVADAVDEVREAADMVTERKGGHGAIREAIELILKIQGLWPEIMKRYLEA